MGDTPSQKCAVCQAVLTFKYNPMPEWDIPGLICGQCYDKKLLDHYIAPDRRSITKK